MKKIKAQQLEKINAPGVAGASHELVLNISQIEKKWQSKVPNYKHANAA